jgi:hypothetical protein
MKNLLFALVILTCPSALQADNVIQNGDFSKSDAYWMGDGKTPQAYAQENPAAATDPLTSRGLIVPLNPASWTRIFQSFTADKSTQSSIVVTYKLSPDIALSKDPLDYAKISSRLQIPGFENFGSIDVHPGQFYGTIGDPSSTTIAMEVFTPKLGSSDVQIYQHAYPPIPPFGDKTFALAFPPGTGTVVILSVTVTGR